MTVQLMLSWNLLHPAKFLPLNSQCICTILVPVVASKSQVKTAVDPTAVVTSCAGPKTSGLGNSAMID